MEKEERWKEIKVYGDKNEFGLQHQGDLSLFQSAHHYAKIQN